MRELGGWPGTFLAGLFRERIAGTAAMAGGLLWLPYGLFTMLQPSGADFVYREAQGYSVVVDKTLFTVYSLPGSLALLLTSVSTGKDGAPASNRPTPSSDRVPLAGFHIDEYSVPMSATAIVVAGYFLFA